MNKEMKKKVTLKDMIKHPEKYEEEIFWYFAGVTTVIGIYTIAWLIETILLLK